MDVGESILLRIRAAGRLTVGAAIAGLGTVFAWTSVSGGGDTVLAAVGTWIAALFVGFVVGLQGVVVLVEGVIDSAE
ncbi:hypothetical protein C475_20532 [Halosimplex carlsbadense 2-9-1]|uniref:Transporter n=1 Tax=Halosimplex carlsbadense 2-9-1 TaxID=797114 RepID=M0CC40_9EURY|nr:hypothetical protein [Halosimplex carlsbadense]ELZ20198.1 hypothetical protein C475_20532 [Halosimplex carlsbadense 2-9-1]